MIQFNLLPDVKLEFIKAKRNKRMVILASTIFTGACVGVMIILFMTVQVFQKQHISNLDKSIDSGISDLKNTKDLDKVLTIQNQLKSLSCTADELANGGACLHDKKPAAARLFDYLPKLVPTKVSFQKLDVDFGASTMDISGNADSLSTVNKFVDTLKFTTYKTNDPNSTSKPTFSNVVLSTFALNKDEKDKNKKAQYDITLSFDPLIFDNSKAISLTVPSQITTRSETEKPSSDLFQQPSNANAAGN